MYIMPAVVVDLTISRDEFLKLYRGHAKHVVAQDRSGRNVRFPASILLPYVGHGGVIGTFTIEFDGNNKFVAIKKNHQSG